MKLQPSWVASDLYQVERVFTRAKRKLELVKALSSMNLKSISQPYYIANTASNLLQDEENVDVALTLLERAFDAFPQYRRYLIRNLRNDKIWKNDRFYRFAKRLVLPSELDLKSNPWVGLDEINSYSGNGEVNVFFHEMVQGLKSTDRLADLKESIGELVNQQPQWFSGKAMLALIELASDQKNEARSRLKKLVDDEEAMKTIPAEACWIIGQELDRFDETRETAMLLFEKAISAPSQNSMNQIQYSPVVKLVEGYIKAGRKEDARELLLKQLKSATFDNYDVEYASYQQIENTNWVAQKLLAMECPVDAIRLYRQLLDSPEKLSSATRYNGQGADHYEKNAKSGIGKALSTMDASHANEVVAQLLTVPEQIKTGTAAIDLMLMTPNAKELAKESIKSSHVELLITLSKDATTSKAIAKRFAEIVEQHPQDLSIAIASATWKLKTKNDSAADDVRRLAVLASDQPLESIPEGRRPNSRQRREAATAIPLWLVARECFQVEELSDTAQTLAELSLQAAKRQVTTKAQFAILYEWGKVLVDNGSREEAEAKWSELLELATQRPQRSKKKANPKTSFRFPEQASRLMLAAWQSDSIIPILLHRPIASLVMQLPVQRAGVAAKQAAQPARIELIPPLTLSQFRTAILVAKSAAENGMSGLSRKAVSESLKGGFPVADPVASDLNTSRSTMIVRSSSNEPASDPIELEVVASLKEIVQRWNSKDYPEEDTYQVLKHLVLPVNRPDEIRMYVTASDIMEAKIDSLADPLVVAAKESNHLDALLEEVNERSDDSAKNVPVVAMKTLIAMEQDDLNKAARLLDDLSALTSKGVPSASMQCALLTALRAFDKDELKASAFPILRQSLQQEVQNAASNRNRDLGISGRLPSLVNAYLASTGDDQAVKDYIDSVLVGRQSYYSRYSGDYGLYQQLSDLGTMAAQTAELNLPNVALDMMGRVCDFELSNYGPPDLSVALAIVSKYLRTLPAAERYETWRTWTMPTEGRQTIRFLTEIIRSNSVPPAFLEDGATPKDPHTSRLLSNFTELVSTAAETGKLAELKSEVDSLLEKETDNAEFLSALILIAQNDEKPATQAVNQLFASMKERLKRDNSRRTPTAYGEYLIYQACLQSDSLAHLFEHRLPATRKQLIDTSQSSLIPFLNVDWFHRVTAGSRSDPNAPFAHWIAASSSETAAIQPAWWTSHEGQIVHVSGSGNDTLYFRYPVTGTFKFSVDCFENHYAECDAGYGGITVLSQQWGSRTTIRSASGHESITRPGGMTRTRPGFNRVTIDVADGTMKYLLNNHLVYQEAVGTTSPWLALTTEGNRVTSFRNLRFEGSPQIPRSVALFNDDRMDGWHCSTFGESQPRKRLMAETPENENDSVSYYQRNEPSEFDWSTNGGVLEGRRLEGSDAADQSWIYYHRPLQNNESFQYEFFYDPERTVAHPSIGRIALLLEPDGVKSHWVGTQKWDENIHGIQLDNAIVEGEFQRGPEELPLESKTWNRVELSLKDDVAIVSLNGSIVFERPIETEQSRCFGIFRYKQQATKVRNAVLSGDWPTEIPAGNGETLTTLTKSPAADVVLDIATIADDAMFAPLAAEVVQTARGMEPNEALEMLKAWVLPSASHRNIRLYYALAAPEVGSLQRANRAEQEDSTIPREPWGHVLCPAAELVRVANLLGKLDELVTVVDQFKTPDSVQLRNRNALAALIAMEQGDAEAAKAALREVWVVLRAGLPNELTAKDRAAEFVVAWRTAQDEAFRLMGSDIVRELRLIERDAKKRSNDDQFVKQVNGLFGDIKRALRIDSSNESGKAIEPLSQWTRVPYQKPQLQSLGYRPSTWIGAKGSLQHIPAETWTQLFFQSPLRGPFEVTFEHSTYGYGEVSVAWGMHAAQPLHDLKAVQITKMMHGTKNLDGEVKLPAWDLRAESRFQVDGNRVTTWTNGVKIHEETFDSPPDPWLVIQASRPSNYAVVNNLRILGSPEIPSEINLIEMAGWAAWRADVYGESHSTDRDASTPWKRVGDELTGQLRVNPEAEHVESLLLYQRPMLEDGVIEFETWYEPDAFEVHPALGADAFLIRPDGVRRHRLTKAQYERSPVLPGNEEPVPSSASEIPLKEKDWNRIRLTLAGDSLTISVNDIDVATVAVTEPTHQRQFGLFRYSNKTRCRVRKLVYRGEWPKVLPSIEEQELAYPADGPFVANDLRTTLNEKLDQPLEKLKSKGIATLGPVDQLTVGDDGLRISQHDSTGFASFPGLVRRARADGDYEVTADYRDLEMSPTKDGWGVASGLALSFDEIEKTRVECLLSLNKEGQLSYKAQLIRVAADGTYMTYDQVVIGNASTSGRLRIARRGGEAHCLVAEDGASPFRLLASFSVGKPAISSLAFSNKSSDSVGRSEITLERLTIREQPNTESPSPSAD